MQDLLAHICVPQWLPSVVGSASTIETENTRMIAYSLFTRAKCEKHAQALGLKILYNNLAGTLSYKSEIIVLFEGT